MFAVVMSLQSYVGEDFKLVNSFKATIEEQYTGKNTGGTAPCCIQTWKVELWQMFWTFVIKNFHLSVYGR